MIVTVIAQSGFGGQCQSVDGRLVFKVALDQVVLEGCRVGSADEQIVDG